MQKFKQILLLISIFLFGSVRLTLSQQVIDSKSLTLKELKNYLLNTSKTTEKLLPLLLNEALISKLEYDSLVVDNNQLRLLIKSDVTVDSAYLSHLSYAYATIDELIFYVNEKQDKLANASKKIHRKIHRHIKAVRQAEAAINRYNAGTESNKSLRFGIFSKKRLEPI